MLVWQFVTGGKLFLVKPGTVIGIFESLELVHIPGFSDNILPVIDLARAAMPICGEPFVIHESECETVVMIA